VKFKLDENLGSRWLPLFDAAGHEADTVVQEGLSGAADGVIFETCVREERCLVSLDLDFADVLRFPSQKTQGIALLRPSRGNSKAVLESLLKNLIVALQQDSIQGRLWIVEIGRIRIHESDEVE
jgi:predicted nuclease of predicted toxin-antitoxin system